MGSGHVTILTREFWILLRLSDFFQEFVRKNFFDIGSSEEVERQHFHQQLLKVTVLCTESKLVIGCQILVEVAQDLILQLNQIVHMLLIGTLVAAAECGRSDECIAVRLAAFEFQRELQLCWLAGHQLQDADSQGEDVQSWARAHELEIHLLVVQPRHICIVGMRVESLHVNVVTQQLGREVV